MDSFQKDPKSDLWNSEYISHRSSVYDSCIPRKPTSPVMSLRLWEPECPWSLGAQKLLQLRVCDYEEWLLWFIG